MSNSKQKVELPILQIPTPCPMRWDELEGRSQKRFCDQCTKHVYNFYEMPAADVDSVLKTSQSSTQRVCAQIRRNPDGKVLTAEDNPSCHRKGWRHQFVMLATSLIALLTFGGCESETVSRLLPWLPNDQPHPTEELGDVVIAPPPAVGGEVVMGKVFVPPQPEPQPEPVLPTTPEE